VRDGRLRPHRAIDAVWRIESARLIAGLARMVRDVGLAEELAQDALVAALEQWPESGVPDNPGAWLMATAKHRAIDRCAAAAASASTRSSAASSSSAQASARTSTRALDDDVGDDLLRLVFTPATRCSPPRRASRSRCACSAA
jgi:predicted RNA polymerase sigma factor